MAESSFPWDGDSGAAGVGDCGPYSADSWRDWFRFLFTNDDTTECVVPGYLNTLAVTGGTDQCTVATGKALVAGIWYTNNVATDIVVSRPTVSTRTDRVVLRADFTAQTVRLDVLENDEEGSGEAPVETQTDGTTWEVSLAILTVTTGGVVTASDDRAYLHFNSKVDGANLDTGSVTSTQIANRTRTFLVPGTRAWNDTDSASVAENVDYWGLGDGKNVSVFGNFYVPSDFSSAMVVKPIVQAAASGNIVSWAQLNYGALGQSWDYHSEESSSAIEAITADILMTSASQSAASAAVGDYFQLHYVRCGASVADTIGTTLSYFGWLVTYTADS